MSNMKSNSYRQFVALAASTSMVAAGIAAPAAHAAEGPFTDVGDRYLEAVNYLDGQNITNGKTSTQFGTYQPIIRVDAAVLLAKALGLEPDPAGKSTFTDVPLRAQPQLAILQQEGIVFGKSGTSFDSYKNITRGEAALILAEAFELEGNPDNVPFTDVADRYKAAVAALIENGVTLGKTDTSFGTNDPITRGEYAVFLYKSIDAIGGISDTPGAPEPGNPDPNPGNPNPGNPDPNPGNPGNPGDGDETDTVAPDAPEIFPVNSDDTTITGRAEPGSTVRASAGGEEIGTAVAGENGIFAISLDEALEAGTVVEVTATDEAGNESDPATVTVNAVGAEDTEAPLPPVVNPVSSEDTVVTGTGEPGAGVTVTIGDDSTTGTVDEDGTFEIPIEAQPDGTEIEVVLTDGAGNSSDPVTVIVGAGEDGGDGTIPAAPNVTADDETNTLVGADATMEYSTDGGDTWTAYDPENPPVFEGEQTVQVRVAADGDTPAGEVTTVSFTPNEGGADTEAPGIPEAFPVNDADTVITGRAEPGSTVRATAGGDEIGTIVAGENGIFVIELDEALAADTVIEVTATDEAGNESDPATVTVTAAGAADEAAPLAPAVNPVSEEDTAVTGTGEPGAIVTVEIGEDVIGTGTVNDDGTFEVTIPAQEAGTVIIVTLTDDGGNTSDETAVTVTPAAAGLDELQELVDGYTNSLIEAYFTPETWEDYETALGEANAVLQNGTEEEADAAYQDLLAAYEALEYETIRYAISNGDSATQAVFTFMEAVAPNGPIAEVGGTVANAAVSVSGEGRVLTISATPAAAAGETVEVTLPVGGKPVESTFTWNGTTWELTSVPDEVFVNSNAPGEIGAVIDLSLLDGSGDILDGGITLDQLLSNSNLIRLSLLPGSGLVAGDVIQLGTPDFNLLSVTLTEDDLNRGYVDLGINTDLLDTLTGGETLPLEAIVTRDAIELVNGVVGALPLPEFLTTPVTETLTGVGDTLAYVLSGSEPIQVEIPTIGANRVIAGDELYFDVTRNRVIGNPAPERTENPYIITPEDIERGYVEYTFEDDALLLRLLGSLFGEQSLDIAPVIVTDDDELVGETQTVTLSPGVLALLLDLLGGLPNPLG